MFVLTVDQRRSRRDVDRVEDLLAATADTPSVRPFERTAGDEVQAVHQDPVVVVTTALGLLPGEHWSIGIGIGDVVQPLPASTRAGRGPAFERARVAVEQAKSASSHLAVQGPPGDGADDAQAVLELVALLVLRRSEAGWQAVRLVAGGASQNEVAVQLGISKQAVSQRLRTTGWQQEVAGRRVAAALLGRVPS